MQLAYPLRQSLCLKPAKFIPDTTRPVLQTIIMDMSYDYLQLVFNKAIRASSVQLSNFRLQAKRNSIALSYKLSGGVVKLSRNVLTIYLNTNDTATLKLTSGLLKNQNSSFLSFAFNTIADMAGNYLRSIPTTSARIADVYRNDTIGPMLQSFVLDMNARLLTLTFNEPVSASSFNPTDLTFQSRYFRYSIFSLLFSAYFFQPYFTDFCPSFIIFSILPI